MKELEVTLTVRNNRLKERRQALGLSQVDLSKYVGIPIGVYTGFETLKQPPWRKKGSSFIEGEWSKYALKLADFYECDPTDLFPESALKIQTPKRVVKADATELLPLAAARNLGMEPTPDFLQTKNLALGVDKVLSTLTDREQLIIRQRFGLGREEMCLHEVGEEQGVSVERIRQIEAKALRKLRHPSRSRHLKEYADIVYTRPTYKIGYAVSIVLRYSGGGHKEKDLNFCTLHDAIEKIRDCMTTSEEYYRITKVVLCKRRYTRDDDQDLFPLYKWSCRYSKKSTAVWTGIKLGVNRRKWADLQKPTPQPHAPRKRRGVKA